MTHPATTSTPPADGAGGVSWEALQDYFPNNRLGTYLRPLPEHGVIYVKNPKAACSTLLLWLDRIHTGDLDFEPANIHKEHRLPTIPQVGRRQTVRMLRGSAYRFTFVRSPLRRLESVYWDKIVRSHKWRRRVQAVLGVADDPSDRVSFEQFVTALEQQDPLTGMDPHWRPQHLNLLHPLVAYDAIGRLETFGDDLLRIKEESGLPDVALPVRNTSRHTTPDSVYDGRPDLRRRVEALYATDLELYGY
jgi:hypothetical protein